MHHGQREQQLRSEQYAPASRACEPELTIANQWVLVDSEGEQGGPRHNQQIVERYGDVVNGVHPRGRDLNQQRDRNSPPQAADVLLKNVQHQMHGITSLRGRTRLAGWAAFDTARIMARRDRKSTRLNSSHLGI